MPANISKLADQSSAESPHVLVVSPGVYPPDFSGGLLRVHRTLVRLRRVFSFNVQVLAVVGDLTFEGDSQLDGIPIKRFPARMKLGSQISQIAKQMKNARSENVDVVYTIAINRLIYITALWARWYRFPLIVEIVNCSLHEHWLRRLVATWLTRTASLNVAISEPVARQIRAFGVDDRRIWVRPNPVDIERYRFPSADERLQERAARGFGPDDVVHLVAGALASRKNQLFAVEAIEHLDDTQRLCLVGPVWAEDPAYADRLRERIAASPARDRIQLVDRFTDEMHRVMYAADCLWMPSLEEGLGNVMLEALCCGVPCIINEALGMDEHIQDGVNGRQAPLDPEAWAAAVTSLLPTIRDFDRRRAISEAACQRYDAAAFDQEFYRRLTALARREAEA